MVQNNFSDEVILSILQALVAKAVAPVKDELVLRNMMLNTQVSELNTQVGEPNTQVGEPNTQVGELNTQVGELNTQVARLQGELNLTMAQYLNILGLLHMRGLMGKLGGTTRDRSTSALLRTELLTTEWLPACANVAPFDRLARRVHPGHDAHAHQRAVGHDQGERLLARVPGRAQEPAGVPEEEQVSVCATGSELEEHLGLGQQSCSRLVPAGPTDLAMAAVRVQHRMCGRLPVFPPKSPDRGTRLRQGLAAALPLCLSPCLRIGVKPPSLTLHTQAPAWMATPVSRPLPQPNDKGR